MSNEIEEFLANPEQVNGLRRKLQHQWKIPLNDIDEVFSDVLIQALNWYRHSNRDNVPFYAAVFNGVRFACMSYRDRAVYFDSIDYNEHESDDDIERVVHFKRLLERVTEWIQAIENEEHRYIVSEILLHQRCYDDLTSDTVNPRMIVSRYREMLKEEFYEEMCWRP